MNEAHFTVHTTTPASSGQASVTSGKELAPSGRVKVEIHGGHKGLVIRDVATGKYKNKG